MEQTSTPDFYLDEASVLKTLLPRPWSGHKGCFGHALLVCGSEGMIGAAVLAASGALRSGCGLVTVHLPREERASLQARYPAALVNVDEQAHFSQLPQRLQRFTAIGVGPGLGLHPDTSKALEALLPCGRPMVLDADALTLLAAGPHLQELVPAGSILTPHLGELRRLVGEWGSDADRDDRVRNLARRLSAYVVMKGAHTMICTPESVRYFNTTGNAGMAKGGSGDVLTGLITGLLARGFPPLSAAIVGVYLHGKAGDKAAQHYGQEGMNAGDLADFIGEVWAEWECKQAKNPR